MFIFLFTPPVRTMKTDIVTMRDGTQLVLPVAENYKDCLNLIQSDLFRKRGKRVSHFRIILQAVFNPFHDFMIWFRLCQHKGILFPWCVTMYRLYQNTHKIKIPLKTRIGYGCLICHRMCIVVHKNTVIGNNVNLSHFLNIGSNHNTPAVIGNEVYIGPMTCLVEDVQIGNNVTIGAGAVVTKDIPAAAIAAGVPAKIIRNEFRRPGHCWDVTANQQ